MRCLCRPQERHRLRKAMREEQRKLDERAATEEVLFHERDERVKREKQAEMALVLTKQEAQQRRRNAAMP